MPGPQMCEVCVPGDRNPPVLRNVGFKMFAHRETKTNICLSTAVTCLETWLEISSKWKMWGDFSLAGAMTSLVFPGFSFVPGTPRSGDRWKLCSEKRPDIAAPARFWGPGNVSVLVTLFLTFIACQSLCLGQPLPLPRTRPPPQVLPGPLAPSNCSGTDGGEFSFLCTFADSCYFVPFFFFVSLPRPFVSTSHCSLSLSLSLVG